MPRWIESLKKHILDITDNGEGVYMHFIGDDEYRYNKAICNKWRDETHPSFIIRQNRDGIFYHKDYGDESWKGDCFSLVKKIYGITNEIDTIKIIDKELSLKLFDNGSVVYSKKQYTKKVKPKEQPKKEQFLIQIIPAKEDKRAEGFLKRYYLSLEDLNFATDTKAYYVNKWYFNKELRPNDQIVLAYVTERGVKIYQPYADKIWKWRSTIPFDFIHNEKAIWNDDPVIITKSVKDAAFIYKFINTNVCAVQAESRSAFTQKVIEKLKSKPSYIIFDQDKKGIEEAAEIAKLINGTVINFPEKWKDVTDGAFKYGKHIVTEYIKNKIEKQ